MANAVRRSRAGLGDPRRPIGSFLFMGPTGVGKTELARALAEFLFDDEKAMVRIDMSEYMEKHAVARLIGAPPGYVGYDEGGQLTEAVRRRPYAVVLFDEIEKAHPRRLQHPAPGARRRPAHRRQGPHGGLPQHRPHHDQQRGLRPHPGDGPRGARTRTMQGPADGGAAPDLPPGVPEPHRRDRDLPARSGQEQIEQIVDIQLRDLQKRLAERKITLELTEEARKTLAERGYDPVFGARPLKRAIQRMVENPLAVEILGGQFREGDHIIVDTKDRETFTFSKKAAVEQPA